MKENKSAQIILRNMNQEIIKPYLAQVDKINSIKARKQIKWKENYCFHSSSQLLEEK